MNVIIRFKLEELSVDQLITIRKNHTKFDNVALFSEEIDKTENETLKSILINRLQASLKG